MHLDCLLSLTCTLRALVALHMHFSAFKNWGATAWDGQTVNYSGTSTLYSPSCSDASAMDKIGRLLVL